MWWTGPDFLKNDCSTYSVAYQTIKSTIEIPEIRQNKSILMVAIESNNYIERFEKYTKMIRVTARILRLAYNIKNGTNKRFGDLSTEEIINAENQLIRIVQSTDFTPEFKMLKKGQQVDNKSQLKLLAPFLDENDKIRVGGRLSNSDLAYDAKHPIVLSHKSHFSKILLQYLHVKNKHCGPQALLAASRQNWWIINGKNAAKYIVHRCHTCIKMKPKSCQQIMAELPAFRVQQIRPFVHSGVEYAGPFITKNQHQRKGQLIKSWIAVFVCLATKAVHLEVVEDLTSESFIATLKRFFATRGRCGMLWSDNGTNFVGAKNSLNELYSFLSQNQSEITNFCADERMDWKFIPPRAPNFGGLWEAKVKGLKHHLKRSVGETPLYFTELHYA
jgi:hypothetical protein